MANTRSQATCATRLRLLACARGRRYTEEDQGKRRGSSANLDPCAWPVLGRVPVTSAVVTGVVVTCAVVTIRVLIGTHVHRSSDDERNLRVGLFNALGEFEGAGRRVFPGSFAVVILDLPIQGYLVGFPRAIREGRC